MGCGVTKGVGDGVRSGLPEGKADPDGLAVGNMNDGEGVSSGDGVNEGDADSEGDGESVGSTAIDESVGRAAEGRFRKTIANAPPMMTTPARARISSAKIPWPMPKPPAC